MKNDALILTGVGAFILFLASKSFGQSGAASSDLIKKMADSIQDWEGWYSGSIAMLNNNPGNLVFRGQPGAYAFDENNYAIFDSYTSGRKALERQLEISFNGQSSSFFPDMNLYQFFDVYAEANSENYAEKVARDLGVDPDMTLNEIAIYYGG